nr:G-protein coupled receptor 157 isoform X1 [Zootoca vivipara]
MPHGALRTELYPFERVVVLVSCALSFLGSSLLVGTHALWPELRTRPRQLLLYLSLADLLSAASYFYGALKDFGSSTWDCVAQGAVSTFSNTSSFFWTMAIALYLYISIVQGSPTGTSLLCFFHVVSWGVPLVITVLAVILKKIGYDASDVSVGWCWINIEAEDRILWMLLAGKLWEILAYVTLPVFYILIKKHINRAVKVMSGAGKKGATGPTERRLSRQENGKESKEIKDYDNLMAEIRKEFKHNEQYIDKKLSEVQETLDKKLEGLVTEVNDLTVRSKTMDDNIKKTQKDLKETKKETEKIREEMSDMNKLHEDILDSIALLEMRQKQLNLKFRGIPEEANENIRLKIVTNLAVWLGLKEEEVDSKISNAFRIKVRSVKAKAKKLPGDCLVTFTSMDFKNRVMRESYNNSMKMEGRTIIVFKEVPIRFLKKRDPYKELAGLLSKNGVSYRWEYPQGLIFYYKNKRFTLTNAHDLDKFARKYYKFLGKPEMLKPETDQEEKESKEGTDEEDGEQEEETEPPVDTDTETQS